MLRRPRLLSSSNAFENTVLRELRLIRRRLRKQTAELEALRTSVPTQMVSLTEAAAVMGLNRQTVVKMLDRGELQGRRAGRKVLIDLSSAKARVG